MKLDQLKRTRKLPRDSDSETDDEEWSEDDDLSFEEMEYKKVSGDEDEVEFDYVPNLEKRTRSGRQRKRPSFFQVTLSIVIKKLPLLKFRFVNFSMQNHVTSIEIKNFE